MKNVPRFLYGTLAILQICMFVFWERVEAAKAIVEAAIAIHTGERGTDRE
jgi:hypothetical protein